MQFREAAAEPSATFGWADTRSCPTRVTRVILNTRLDPGTQLNDTYEIDERIASGGMGEVYRGHNIQTGEPVAIKTILPELAEQRGDLRAVQEGSDHPRPPASRHHRALLLVLARPAARPPLSGDGIRRRRLAGRCA